MLESFDSNVWRDLASGGFDSPLVTIGGGLLLLAFGRRLYWLLVAVAGFVLGYSLFQRFVGFQPGLPPLVLGALVGLLGAGAAVFFQRVALGIVGFLAGGLAMIHFAATLDWEAGYWIWIAALGAGILGSLLARSIFELALVVATSIIGAVLVTMPLAVPPPAETLLVVGLVVVGVVVQLRIARRSGGED